MRVTGKLHQTAEMKRFLKNLDGPEMQKAGARGLTEHAHEQRRQSVVRIANYTGVPAARIRSKSSVTPAAPGRSATATVTMADEAIPLGEYGAPVWRRDLNPGWKGGPVSSMRGAEATGWNVRRTFPGTWVANGHVFRRSDPDDPRSNPVILYSAVLANELAKPTRPNVPAAERFMQLDLEKRVTRHIIRSLGT